MSLVIDFDLQLDNAGSSPWVVEAYRIHVTGPLSLPSGSIELRAREIIFEANGAINVDGGKGDPWSPAEPPKVAGEDGKAGDPQGHTGKPGGSITLICERLIGNVQLSAIGGDGAPGQDASNGNKGGQGDPGQPGKPGGKGAYGGRGGDGGPGGQVTIYACDKSHATIPNPFVQGGGPGAAGHDGQPGAQGDHGGPPPRQGPPPSFPGSNRGGDKFTIEQTNLTMIGSPPSKAGTGQGGNVTVHPAADVLAALKSSVSLEYLQLLLDRAETNYYNRQFSDAGELLTYLSVISS